MSEEIRLDKHLVMLIKCSRGEAQRYIEGGWVTVDGDVVEQPQFKILNQAVELRENASDAPTAPATILFNMPEGFNADDASAALKLITPENRADDDRCGIQTLKRHFSGIKTTAPLEAQATGLMVFSHDKRILRRLIEEASKNEQEYVVEVTGEVEEGGLDKIKRGMKQDNWVLPATKVSWQNEDRLRFALKNVRPGQIEFMCNSIGLEVVSMNRIRLGRVSMGKLKAGEWRYLPAGVLF